MNDRLDDLDTVRFTRATHEVTNQPPPLVGYNAWIEDGAPRDGRARGGGWVDEQAASLGDLVGSERMQLLANQANRSTPELRTHDSTGHRVDEVAYHPAYHELMQLAFEQPAFARLDRRPRRVRRPRRAQLPLEPGRERHLLPGDDDVRRRAGAACPPRRSPRPGSRSCSRGLRPAAAAGVVEVAATVGMAMTEKQGGSDLRANQTRARRLSADLYELRGHKWFCSAPMSDGFLTLALLDGALTCFFVPRSPTARATASSSSG